MYFWILLTKRRAQYFQSLNDVFAYGTDADVQFFCHLSVFHTSEVAKLENLLGLWSQGLYRLVHGFDAPFIFFPRVLQLCICGAVQHIVELDVLVACRLLSDVVDALVVNKSIEKG